MEKIISWFLVKTGHKQMGNYIYLDGKYRHIRAITWDFMGGCLFSVILLGWVCVMWFMLVII